MAYNDSFDKIVDTYFSTFNREEFVWKNKTYTPKNFYANENLAKTHRCYKDCGGCCCKFSLDYIPSEPLPYEEGFKTKEAFGKKYFSDEQEPGWHCKHLIKENGFCGIHGKHPFSCDFEAIRIHKFKESDNRVSVAPFGRAWALLKVDGQRGGICTFDEPTQEGANESARKLKRLKEWMDYFEIKHCVDDVIEWLESGAWKMGKKVFVVEGDNSLENFF